MATGGGLDAAVGQLGRLWGGGAVAGLSEGQLLDRFLAAGDESAFAALVARHGPMVRGVCRRCLGEGPDADDAFQATFLVLVKKAAAIRDRDLLANWLYGVALKVAARSRSTSIARRRRAAVATPDPSGACPGAAEEAMRRELSAAVQREVDGLPESYRKAVVLCDLSGFSHEEAARRLAWPVGTVKGRHFRARQMLRDRLERRGLGAASAGLIAPAPVEIALVQSTIRAATAVAAGGAALTGSVPGQVAALMQGVISAMSLSKLKLAAATLAVAGFVTAGAAVSAQGFGPAESQDQSEARKTAGTPTKSAIPAAPPNGAAPARTSGDAEAREKLVEERLRSLGIARRDGGKVDVSMLDSLKELYEDAVKNAWPAKKARLLAAIDRANARVVEVSNAKDTPSKGPELTGAQAGLFDAEVALMTAEKHFERAKEWAEAFSRGGDNIRSMPAMMGGGGGVMNSTGAGMMGGGMGGMSAMGGGMGGVGGGMGFGMGGRGGMGGGRQANAVGATPGEGDQGGGAGGGGGLEDPEFQTVDDNVNSQLIAKSLEAPATFNFPHPTPLSDVLKYMKTATQTANYNGIQYYVDPIGLERAGCKVDSEVSIDLDGVPLKAVMKLALRQLSLTYVVRSGVMIITASDPVTLTNLDVALRDDDMPMPPRLRPYGSGGMGGMQIPPAAPGTAAPAAGQGGGLR